MGQGVPRKFGNCSLVEQIAQGATAVVYLAHHEGLGIDVAVKVLRHRLSAKRPEYAERFLREARVAARLEHPNIVRVLDCGVESGYHYMVMDHAEGQNALEMVQKQPDGLDWRHATEMVRQAAHGLEHAAHQGITHRDVKPSNLLVENSGRVRVTDLGLAKVAIGDDNELTQELYTVGTPNYMSPEQIRSPSKLDLRSDIYSLGATYYHLVTGRPPFLGDNPMEVVSKHLTEAVVAPHKVRASLPGDVSKVIRKMMAKSADHRYQSYETLLRDLDSLLAGSRVSAGDFEETYVATEEDEGLLRMLERLAKGTSLEVEYEEEPDRVSDGDSRSAASGSSAMAPFGRADLRRYSTRPAEESTRLGRRRGEHDRLISLILTLAMIGLLTVATVTLLAFLARE
jgi:serine/threonine protein kinase